MLNADPANASIKYGQFVHDGLSQEARPEFGMGNFEERVLGDDAFADKALQQAEEKPANNVSMDEIISEECRCYGISESTFSATGKGRPASEARAVAAFLVQETPHLSMTELAKRTGQEISAISHAAQRLERILKKRKPLELMTGRLLDNLPMSNMTR